jgi:hypothetical protein
MNRVAILLVSALLLAGTAAAQESAPKEKVRTFTFTQDEPITMVSPFSMMQRERLHGDHGEHTSTGRRQQDRK